MLCTITKPKTPHKFFPVPFPPFRHTGHVCWRRKMFAQHISIYEHHNTLSSCHRFFFLSETDISKQFLPLNIVRHKPHSFPHYKSNVIMLKKREKESCNIYFWWPWNKICEESQYLAFATLHKWRSRWRPTSIFRPHFALGTHTCWSTLHKAWKHLIIITASYEMVTIQNNVKILKWHIPYHCLCSRMCY